MVYNKQNTFEVDLKQNVQKDVYFYLKYYYYLLVLATGSDIWALQLIISNTNNLYMHMYVFTTRYHSKCQLYSLDVPYPIIASFLGQS